MLLDVLQPGNEQAHSKTLDAHLGAINPEWYSKCSVILLQLSCNEHVRIAAKRMCKNEPGSGQKFGT